MIPKKIHYCWLSNDPYPDKIAKCINSWKKNLPDYEIVKWDLKRFPLEKSNWVRQAYEKRKYAFAADYIRLYALFHEGGIYLDSDVEVLKNYDDLLDLPYFICKENSPQGIEAATIGAEPKCAWIGDCLNYYKNRDFIDSEGMNMKVLPAVLKEILQKKYSIKEISGISEFGRDPQVIYLLPCDYFSPKNYVTKRINITKNTYSVHHFSGTWQPWWKKLILRIWVPFSVLFPNLAKKLKTIKPGIIS